MKNTFSYFLTHLVKNLSITQSNRNLVLSMVFNFVPPFVNNQGERMDLINGVCIFFLEVKNLNHLIKLGQTVKKKALLSDLGSKRILFHFYSSPPVASVHQQRLLVQAPLGTLQNILYLQTFLLSRLHCTPLQLPPKAEVRTFNFPVTICIKPVPSLLLSG